jgi:hypothetical protein
MVVSVIAYGFLNVWTWKLLLQYSIVPTTVIAILHSLSLLVVFFYSTVEIRIMEREFICDVIPLIFQAL